MAPCGSTISPWRSGPARWSAWPASRATARASSAWCWPGLLRPTEGRFYIGDTDLTHAGAAAVTAAGGGIVPEDRHAVACVTAMSVAENMFLNKLDRFTRFGLLQRRALNEATRGLMRTFDVRAAGPEVAFSGLCGGNQQKAVLARELTLDPLVALVAAQPTRGLDVSAVEAVYRQIRAAARRGVGVLLDLERARRAAWPSPTASPCSIAAGWWASVRPT